MVITVLFATSRPRWWQAMVLRQCCCQAGLFLVSLLVQDVILGRGIRPGADGAPGGAEVPGSGQVRHMLPASARQVGRRWSGEGHDGGAHPVFAAAVVISDVDL